MAGAHGGAPAAGLRQGNAGSGAATPPARGVRAVFNNMPIIVFELADGNIARVVRGEKIGTLVGTGDYAND